MEFSLKEALEQPEEAKTETEEKDVPIDPKQIARDAFREREAKRKEKEMDDAISGMDAGPESEEDEEAVDIAEILKEFGYSSPADQGHQNNQNIEALVSAKVQEVLASMGINQAQPQTSTTPQYGYQSAQHHAYNDRLEADIAVGKIVEGYCAKHPDIAKLPTRQRNEFFNAMFNRPAIRGALNEAMASARAGSMYFTDYSQLVDAFEESVNIATKGRLMSSSKSKSAIKEAGQKVVDVNKTIELKDPIPRSISMSIDTSGDHKPRMTRAQREEVINKYF